MLTSTINIEQMGKGYVEMGELNLKICNDSHLAENNDYKRYENNLKEV